MKKIFREKYRLVLTITVCGLFLATAFSSVIGNPIETNITERKESDNPTDEPRNPKPLPIFNFRILNKDWNYWSNKPNLFSIPDGNVGIGTNDPQASLDIFDFDEPAEIRLTSGLSGGSCSIIFENGGWIIRSGLASPPQSLSFRYIGDEIMTLRGDNVGIGTSSPSTKLHVNGTINTTGLVVGAIGSTFSEIQSGSHTMTKSGQGVVKEVISFPSTFTSTPKVIASIKQSQDRDCFAITTYGSSTTGFTALVYRVDSQVPWAQTLYIEWIAWT